MTEVPDHVVVDWPMGPIYTDWVSAKGVSAWIRYKAKSADWYIEVLELLGAHIREYDRYVGVEMALDGAFACLCGAFDAAVGGLTAAAETKKDGKPSTPAHQVKWSKCQELLEQPNYNGEWKPLVTRIGEALDGNGGENSIGWLTVLRRLRNRAVHANTLSRHFNVTAEDETAAGTMLRLPGGSSVQPVEYLRESSRRVHALCEEMITAIAQLGGTDFVSDDVSSLTVKRSTSWNVAAP